jgi:hypothetical protein
MKRTTLSLACQRWGLCAREKPDLSGLAGVLGGELRTPVSVGGGSVGGHGIRRSRCLPSLLFIERRDERVVVVQELGDDWQVIIAEAATVRSSITIFEAPDEVGFHRRLFLNARL